MLRAIIRKRIVVLLLFLMFLPQLFAENENMLLEFEKGKWLSSVDVKVHPEKKTYIVGEKIDIVITAWLNENHIGYYPEDKYLLKSSVFQKSSSYFNTTSINVSKGELEKNGYIAFADDNTLMVDLSTSIDLDFFYGHIALEMRLIRRGLSIAGKRSGKSDKKHNLLQHRILYNSETGKITYGYKSKNLQYPKKSPEADRQYFQREKERQEKLENERTQFIEGFDD